MTLFISGSSREGSNSRKLIDYIIKNFPELEGRFFPVETLPLFNPNTSSSEYPVALIKFKNLIAESKALLVITPEYLSNVPAQIKNALEWLAESGEMNQKKVLAISFTPYPPRGQKALESLINSLISLKSNILPSLELYYENLIKDKHIVIDNDSDEFQMLKLALNFF